MIASNKTLGSFSFKNLPGFAGLFRGPGAVRKPRLPAQGSAFDEKMEN